MTFVITNSCRLPTVSRFFPEQAIISIMLKSQAYGPVRRIELARTIAGRGRYWTVCYQIGSLLIDTGCAHTARELLQLLSDRPPEFIINTHTHEDHIGANGLLQQAYSPAIAAHPLALPVLADPRREQPLHPYRRLFWGWPTPSQAEALSDEQVLERDGHRWRIYFTPGHSDDHLCLFEENHGWLFSGDLFVGGRDRAIRQGCDIWQIIASLKRMAALPVEILFPGSARVRENPLTELQAKIAYYEELGGKILQLHQAGLSRREIRRRLLGGPMFVEFVTLGHFARWHLIEAYLNGTSF